jgi:hypothetical protein
VHDGRVAVALHCLQLGPGRQRAVRAGAGDAVRQRLLCTLKDGAAHLRVRAAAAAWLREEGSDRASALCVGASGLGAEGPPPCRRQPGPAAPAAARAAAAAARRAVRPAGASAQRGSWSAGVLRLAAGRGAGSPGCAPSRRRPLSGARARLSGAAWPPGPALGGR